MGMAGYTVRNATDDKLVDVGLGNRSYIRRDSK